MIDQRYAVIAHLDVLEAMETGQATCRLVLVDLEAGRYAGDLCVKAREWEKRTDVFSLVADGSCPSVTVPVVLPNGFPVAKDRQHQAGEGQATPLPSPAESSSAESQVVGSTPDSAEEPALIERSATPEEVDAGCELGVAYDPAPISPAESPVTDVEHPEPDSAGDTSRRDVLLKRYRNLNRAQKLAYLALNVDKGDLDAVEAALVEVDPFAKRQTMTGKCRSCDADIAWAVTENNKPIPLDVDPVEGGNLIVVDGVARAPRLGEESIWLYVSHFATCPNADKHRAPKPTPPEREGGLADPAAVAALQAHFGKLSEPDQAWIKGLLKEANTAGVPFHNGGDTGVKSIRRFELSRAVVRLAESTLVDPLPAEVARGLAERLAGGRTADIPLGEVIGGFGAELATQFAIDVDKYLADLQGETP